MTTPTGKGPSGIPYNDWLICTYYGKKYNVDPYLLVAIGMWETGWGTKGLGLKGLTLGVGAYDKGPVYTWKGVDKQVHQACIILQKHGVKNIDDVKAGKAAFWTSTPGWQAGVVDQYNKAKGYKAPGIASGPGFDQPILGSSDVGQSISNGIAKAMNAFLSTFRDLGISVLVVVGAAILIVLGVVILLRKPLEKAASVAGKVVK